MKRYISLACVALIVVMCMVEPVSAEEIPIADLIQILDYFTANNSGSNYVSFSGSSLVRYEVPADSDFNYIDILVRCSGSALTQMRAGGYDSFLHDLNILDLGNNLYRVYGHITTSFFPELVIEVNSAGQSWLTFLSINIGLSGNFVSDIESYCHILADGVDKTIHFIPTDEVNYRIFTGPETVSTAEYTLTLYLDDSWKKYDYVDFLMMTRVKSVTSITAGFGSGSIPFSVSYLDNDNISNEFIYNVRIDLRDIDRSTSDYPIVTIVGTTHIADLNYIGVLATTGYLAVDVQDPDVFWLNQIFNKLGDVFNNITALRNDQNTLFVDLYHLVNAHFANLNSWIQTQTTSINESLWSTLSFLREDLFIYFGRLDGWISTQTNILESAIRGDTAPGDGFQQQINQKDHQLNDMAAVMDSVEQPDLNSINVSANTYVDSTLLAASMSGITSVFSQGLYFNLIVMSIMMATAGYVLFGKR